MHDRFTFPGHAGDALAARLERPSGPIRAAALFAHCFTCGKDIAAARRIAARLASNGVAVLSFDFTGLGHSEGEFANTHFTSNVDDLVEAAKAMEARGMPPALLIGHSLGGAAVLAAAPQIASARAVVTIGAPHDPAHVAHNFGGALAEIHDKGAAEVSLAGRPFTIKKDFLDDIAGASLDAAIAGMKKALLVMHAPGDDTVGIENASAIFMAAKHPKSFVTLDKADHLVTRREDADYAADVIAAWADRYLPAAPDADIPEGVVRVSETGNRYQQDVSARGHHLTADEPSSVGGLDTGMTPYELVSAGLGACTAMTLRMYAQRKGLKLDHVEVDIAHNKVHAADCETCETTEGKIDRFARTIRIEGDLTEAERARLLEIADRCPVHRTLEREVQVTTEAG